MAAPRIIPWSPSQPGWAVEETAEFLMRGEVVVLPTETVYGLSAAAELQEGYDRLLRIKGGSAPRAFLLLFDTPERLAGRVGELPPGGESLARAFWPGPLTLLFPAPADLPAWWSGPDGDVAARVTSHPLCRELVARLNAPVLSTSANRAGEDPCDSAAAVARVFAGTELALIVDGGPLMGRPSTILRWSEKGWTTLRPGPIPAAVIESVLSSLPEAGA